MQLLLAVRSLDLIAVGTPAHFSWQCLSFQLTVEVLPRQGRRGQRQTLRAQRMKNRQKSIRELLRWIFSSLITATPLTKEATSVDYPPLSSLSQFVAVSFSLFNTPSQPSMSELGQTDGMHSPRGAIVMPIRKC